MTHGTELNIANQKQAEKRTGSTSSTTRSQEAPHIQTSSTVPEISNESIQVKQVEIRRDSTVDAELSDHLEQYRETLNRSSESVITSAAKVSTDTSHHTRKSASLGSKKKLKGKHNSPQEVSLLEDPLGFLANLLTKLERALLRSLRGDKDSPLPAVNPQPSMTVPQLKKRKKKKGGSLGKGPHRGTQLTTLYHLEHLNNDLHALDASSEQDTNAANHSKN